MARGPVAQLECVQCIPCNPCEQACAAGAISVGNPITNRPVLDAEKCVGCGKCISKCPGLAITVIDMAYGNGLATLDFPYEYIPLPEPGDRVTAVDREGVPVCGAEVLSVSPPAANGGTGIIRIAFPLAEADRVKSVRRLTGGDTA